jgi:hypothetical protein
MGMRLISIILISYTKIYADALLHLRISPLYTILHNWYTGWYTGWYKGWYTEWYTMVYQSGIP